jgi:hypothetical protein
MFSRYQIALIVLGVASIARADVAPTTAPSDHDNAVAEVKTDEEAIKSIGDELKQDQKDAADAEALAANPPADVTADRKDAYIDAQKNTAQTAHDAVKDAQERLDEAKKSLEEAKANLNPTTAPAAK